jgi:hypothetical protein
MAAGLLAPMYLGLDDHLGAGLVGGLVVGLAAELIYKLSTGLAVGLSGCEIAAKTVPNEGIHRSAWMAVSSGLGAGLAVTLVFGLGAGLFVGVDTGLGGGLVFGLGGGLGPGLLVGLATGLRYGGRACFQHSVLRLSLRYYDCMPRHYTDFLNYTVERLFLRRVGGGYIFIHRLLQEYFAMVYQADHVDSPPSPSPPPP